MKKSAYPYKPYLLYKYLPLTCFGLVLLIMGCVEEVDPKNLIDTNKKVVVNSLISPANDSIQVEVSLSKPILGDRYYDGKDDPDIIKDAIVKLSGGSATVTLPYNAKNAKYGISQKAFPIEQGKEYRLEVEAQGGVYKARCQVPKIAAGDIAVRVTVINDGNRVYLSWKDVPEEESYYWVGASYRFRGQGFSLWNKLYFYEEAFKRDLDRDGGTITADTESDNTYWENGVRVPIDSVNVDLYTTDKNFYDYYKAVDKYGEDEDNPFSESIRIKGNIEGGLGVFGAYLPYTKKVKVE